MDRLRCSTGSSMRRRFAPHIPVIDKSIREDGTLSRGDFTFDKERNVYICPMGKLLKTTGRILSEHMLRYIASTRDCGACPLKSKCCPNTPARMIPVSFGKSAHSFLPAAWHFSFATRNMPSVPDWARKYCTFGARSAARNRADGMEIVEIHPPIAARSAGRRIRNGPR